MGVLTVILTVTLNPSVDIRYKMDTFTVDTVSRVEDVRKTAGGKGLNVSRVLRQLNMEVAATGFLGGALGQFIREQVGKMDILDRFVPCAGETRNCIAIIHEGQQTELLENGPTISDEEAALFVARYEEAVQEATVVTISGSLPQGLPNDFYNQLLSIAAKFDVPVFVDTSGGALQKAVVHTDKPFLIKPNEEELGALLGTTLNGEADIIKALQQPTFDGISWIVVTLGADGALIRHEDVFYRVRIPSVDVVNPVGSGDSVVAGFAYGFKENFELEKLMKHGVVMGLLNAMEEETGTINPRHVQTYVEQMMVEKIVQ